jgi:hypothetical protein
MKEIESRTSKYIKPTRENQFFQYAVIGFLIALFIMPQYFGLPLPMFDMTILRMMIVILSLMIFMDAQRRDEFLNLIRYSKFTLFLIPYLIVIGYTMVLRVDINAFLNPFIELYSLYLLVYAIKYTLGVDKLIQYIIVFSYILAILGMIEYVMGKSPFSYLETIKDIYTGQFIRSGHYRIMGPCVHSLGYGLLLISIVPFACIDVVKKELNLFAHPFLLVLLAMNVVFTGSRSTLSVFLLEVFLIFLFSTKEKKKTIFFGGILILFLLAIFLIVGRSTSVAQYILLQLTTIVDELFGTSYSIAYGASLADLGSSSNYRDQLKDIFKLDWLNPLLGIGRKRAFASEINGSYIHSVDNFYIAEYIRYAYPGLFAYILFLGYFIVNMIKTILKKHSDICKALFISSVCYLINLYWLDSLQTLKYLYIAFGICICLSDELKNETESEKRTVKEKKTSKYIKKRG